MEHSTYAAHSSSIMRCSCNQLVDCMLRSIANCLRVSARSRAQVQRRHLRERGYRHLLPASLISRTYLATVPSVALCTRKHRVASSPRDLPTRVAEIHMIVVNKFVFILGAEAMCSITATRGSFSDGTTYQNTSHGRAVQFCSCLR